MSKPNGSNGKTETYFEQIPVAAVHKIAIADLPDDRELDRRLVDQPHEVGANYVIRRAADRRKSPTALDSPPGTES